MQRPQYVARLVGYVLLFCVGLIGTSSYSVQASEPFSLRKLHQMQAGIKKANPTLYGLSIRIAQHIHFPPVNNYVKANKAVCVTVIKMLKKHCPGKRVQNKACIGTHPRTISSTQHIKFVNKLADSTMASCHSITEDNLYDRLMGSATTAVDSVLYKIPSAADFKKMKKKFINSKKRRPEIVKTFLAKDVLYLKISGFYIDYHRMKSRPKQTPLQVKEIVHILKKHSAAKELIIDLRGNSGGSVKGIMNIASLFIGRKPITALVTTRHQQTLKGTQSKVFYKPIKVLLDENTGSGAVIFAAALQYFGNAKLYGTRPSQKKLGRVEQLFKLGPYHIRVKVAELQAPYLSGSSFKSLSPDFCLSRHAGAYKVTSYSKSRCHSSVIKFSSKQVEEPQKIINLLRSQ